MYWGNHIEYLITKCRKILNIMKCMASIRWGADREVLLKVYETLIESRLSYGSIIYGSARKSRLKQLDKIQNAALRLATGAFRTSPIEALLVESSVLPLNLRRDMQLLTYASKVQSLPRNLNLQKFSEEVNEYIDTPTRTRPANIRFLETSDKHGINPRFKVTLHHQDVPPWMRSLPIINTILTKWRKESTPPSTYKALFLEQIEQFDQHLMIYTDGSKNHEGVGALPPRL